MSFRSEQVGLFAALNAAGVEYVVVGGVAVNAHGFVRNTRDLDVFFRPTVENAQTLFRALQALDAPVEGMDPTDLLLEEEHYRLHVEEGHIDLLSSIGEMRFEQVWRNRVDAEVEGVTIHFISKQDLIANKRQVGRILDLADAEQLSALPANALLRVANAALGEKDDTEGLTKEEG